MDCLHDKSKTFAFFALCNMHLWAEKRRRQEGSWNCFHVTLWRPQPFPQIDSESDTSSTAKVDQRHLGDRSFLELFLRNTLKTAALPTVRAWARLIDSEFDTVNWKSWPASSRRQKFPGTVSTLHSQDRSPLHSKSLGTVDRFWIWHFVNRKRWTASSRRQEGSWNCF